METKIFTIALALVCVAASVCMLYQGFKNSVYTVQEKRKKTLLISLSILAWVVYISVLTLTGFIQDWSSFPPKIFVLILLPAFVLIPFLIFSGRSDKLIRGIDGRFLIYIQTFRVLVEILLWMMLKEGLIPIQMSFEGRNFDILVGLTAPIAGYLIYKNPLSINRPLQFGWNLFGLGFLINIVSIAILSSPVPFRVFMNEPSNTMIADFPYVFIPAVFVVLACTMHFMSLRKWYLER